MDQLAAQPRPVVATQLGVRQIHGQYGVVFLHIGAEEQQRGAVQPQFELRQEPRVMQIDAVGVAGPGDDIATRVEQSEGIARFEGARPALLKRDVRFDVKRRRLVLADRPKSRRRLPGIAPGTQAASRRPAALVLKTTAFIELRRSTSQ